MSVRFSLHRRTHAAGRERTLRIFVNRFGRQITVSTPLRFKSSEWSQAKQQLHGTVPGSQATNAALRRLKNDVQILTIEHHDDEDLRRAIMARVGNAPKEKEPTILELYDAFTEHKRARVKASTMQVYEALRGHLERYVGGTSNSLAAISAGWLDDFVSDLLRTGVANSTANKLRTRCKGFLAWLFRMEHIEAVPESAPLKAVQSDVIRLTLDELDRLRRVDLTGAPEGHRAARDLFLMGCFTGARFSDLSRIQWSDVKGDVWYMREQKTDVTRRVPLAPAAVRIIESYRGEKYPLPRLSNQKSNAYLKLVARQAGITEPVELRSQKGGIVETETAEKCDVLSTHAARRTFVSILMESGASAKDMLGISHSDLRSLQRYAASSENHLRKKLEVFSEVGS